MTLAESVSFEAGMDLHQDAPGRFTTHLLDAWSSLVGIHGGFTASIAVRAITTTVGAADRPLRSVSTQFVSPPRPGPATIDVTVERAGRTASFATAKVRQEGHLRLLVTAMAAVGRAGAEYDVVTSPRTPLPPPGLGRISPPPAARPDGRIGHFANAELLLDPDTVPFAGGPDARLAGWIRPLPGDRVTAEWLVCALDFFPPAVFARLHEPVPAATVDYTVQFLATDLDRRVEPGDYVYAEMHSRHAAGGYAVEDGIAWGPDGATLATSRQLRLAGG